MALVTASELDTVRENVENLVFDMFKLAIDPKSPYETMESFIETVTYSNQKVENLMTAHRDLAEARGQ